MKSLSLNRWTFASVVCAALLLPSGAALADKLVDGGGGTIQNEIDLTLIPGQAGGLVMAYNDYASGNTLGIAYSTDYGVNWSTTQLTMPTVAGVLPLPPTPAVPMTRMFDPTITADANGNVFAACIADGANDPMSNPLGGADSGFYAFKSTNGGQSWGSPIQIAYDLPTTVGSGVDPNYRFNDRCRIRADTYTTSSSYTNYVYATWIKDRGLQDPNSGSTPKGDIYFSYSTPGGTSWSTPVTINQSSNDMANIPVMDIASNGTIYLAWLDYNVWTSGTGQIYLRKSINGGSTFTDPSGGNTDHPVASINLPPLNLSTASGMTDIVAKGNSGTPIAVNPNNSNELYIAYAANPGGGDESDIFVIKSTNGGQSWGSPIRVNDDTGVTDQCFPWMDVKPDGTIDVAWYDKRNSLNDDAWDVYIAKGTGTTSGITFSQNYRLSDVLSSGGWFGEYLGLAVDSSTAYVAFASFRSDSSGDVWFDKVSNSTIPEPTTLALLALGALGILRGTRRRS